MTDRVKKVNYCSTIVSSRAGQGAKMLSELTKAGVSLAAFTGFPATGGKSQLDFIVESMTPVRRIFRENGWTLSKPKKAFLVQGEDEVGAILKHINKLAANKINITAADAVFAGKGRYGMIIWVKPKDYARAARVLGAK